MKNPDKPFQRSGASSNAQVGKQFEHAAHAFFMTKGISLSYNVRIPVGVGRLKKNHAFDLGCKKRKIIVESKSHRWTENNKIPSAKLTVWNEAMYYFLLAPKEYRKIMFVLRHFSEQRQETLAEYYLSTYRHLIPKGVEFWEYNEDTSVAVKV